MRVLITGATGFIGRHLVPLLAERGHAVFAVVRSTAAAAGAQAIAADLERPLATARWPAVDAVVHLAQSARYNQFPAGAGSVFALAALATQGLLEYALRVGARRFIYASTGGLYAPAGRPLRETDPLDIGATPLSHYLACKRAGELLVAAYARAMATTTLRIFFCYGPGQPDAMLIPRLVRSVRDGRPITLAGESGLRINPVFVDDAAWLVARLLESSGPEVVNLAGPGVVSLREIGEALGRLLGRRPVFESDAGAPAPSLVADISRLEATGRPRVHPADGLARLVQSLS
jgi:nucleoside-diphosphate-sugar epimerase